jgi:hypothetical protein
MRNRFNSVTMPLPVMAMCAACWAHTEMQRLKMLAKSLARSGVLHARKGACSSHWKPESMAWQEGRARSGKEQAEDDQ